MQNQSNNSLKIAIIGAGFSGVILGQELKDFAKVTIFEKSRGCGGRMSTRRVDDFAFDHGTQYFTARTQEFQSFLSPHITSGNVFQWQGKVINFLDDFSSVEDVSLDNYFVATPSMNSLCKKLSSSLEIKFETEVAPLKTRENQGWQLKDKNGQELGIYDFVISTAPIVQTINLFDDQISKNHSLRNIVMEPCFALMIGFKEKLNLGWIFARVDKNPIKLISLNSTKPQRNNQNSCFVVHTSNYWAKENVDRNLEEVQEILLQNFSKVTGINTNKSDYISLHRWRYAIVDNTIKNEKPFIDLNIGIAATGDWVTNSRIEDVWFGAKNLAKIIKNTK